MSKQVITILAAAFAAAAHVLTNSVLGDETAAAPETGDGTPQPAKRGPGRPAGSSNAPKPPAEPEKAVGKTREELIRHCESVIKAGGAEQIRALVTKHGGGEGKEAKLTSVPVANQKAFMADVDALKEVGENEDL